MESPFCLCKYLLSDPYSNLNIVCFVLSFAIKIIYIFMFSQNKLMISKNNKGNILSDSLTRHGH